ncbi:MAG: PhzF family phenazine biosynthesis isomerase [Steroidobacteraceae bacterium]
MSRTVRVFQVDAFTNQKFAGNPAGVVLDADALADSEMLAIARELHNADTAFVLEPDGTDHDLRLRFFTPRSEAGFVGHATIAAHFVRARLGADGRRVRQKQSAGMVDVEIRGSDTGRRVAIRRDAPAAGRELASRERLAVLDALALSSGDLDSQCPLQIYGTASSRLLVGVRGPRQLKQLKPDHQRLTTLSAQLGTAGFFVFSREQTDQQLALQSRMFCPAIGIPEDPVSGNAHSLLGAYLLQHRLLTADGDHAAFAGQQGQFVGRPGRVEIELQLAAGQLRDVWIIGEAALVFETTITL